jgi:hypothetical protein
MQKRAHHMFIATQFALTKPGSYACKCSFAYSSFAAVDVTAAFANWQPAAADA